MNSPILKIVLIPIYFSASWFIPWPDYELFGIFPTYLIFDLLFSLIILSLMKSKEFNSVPTKDLLRYSLGATVFSVICIGMIYIAGFVTPFKFISGYEYKLIIFAPIIEELLFRGAFHRVYRSLTQNRTHIVFFSGLIFSVSHAYSLLHTPDMYRPFLIFQVAYTFILGALLGFLYEKYKNILLPIFIHFIFNLIFLLALECEYL